MNNASSAPLPPKRRVNKFRWKGGLMTSLIILLLAGCIVRGLWEWSQRKTAEAEAKKNDPAFVAK